MQQEHIVWQVGGMSGDGIESTSDVFALSLHRMGYWVYTSRTFASLIRGGYTAGKISIYPEQVRTHGGYIDILIAFSEETLQKNGEEVRKGSVVLFDSSAFTPAETQGLEEKGVQVLGLPMTELAKKFGPAVMKNMVAVGVSAALLGLSEEEVEEVFQAVLEDRLGKKGEAILQANMNALREGYQACKGDYGSRFQLPKPTGAPPALLISGNEAVAVGALAGGCRFLSAYPITPATEVMYGLVHEMPKLGGMVIQVEDEIAAINLAVGAGFAGARSMTNTSGPGLSLMMEALGLAGMTETPVVIINVQRAGPSTGMPTKIEQSDLFQLVYGSHGEITRIVLAPATAEECFYMTAEAFNLAEEYQCPVLVATDLVLGMSKQSEPEFDLDQVAIRRGKLLSPDELSGAAPGTYLRYEITEDGISPRSIPGMEGGIFRSTGVEHDFRGKVSEDPAMRTRMMDKRKRKTERLDLSAYLTVEGQSDADLIVIGWGSTLGPLREARRQLEKEGIPLLHLHLGALKPLPEDALRRHLRPGARVVVAEHNQYGQLSSLLQPLSQEVHWESLLKYDGRSFDTVDVLNYLKGVKQHG